MIIFDTETTKLLEPSLAASDKQPRIIEFAAIKVDFEFNVIAEKSFFCNPGVEIDAKITKITGLTNDDLREAKPFIYHLATLQDFFLGEHTIIAHNLAFDRGVLAEELKRVDSLLKFPWPFHHLCTVELTQDLHLKDRKLTTLYEHYMGKPLAQTHRAMGDVEAMLEFLPKMREEGRL